MCRQLIGLGRRRVERVCGVGIHVAGTLEFRSQHITDHTPYQGILRHVVALKLPDGRLAVGLCKGRDREPPFLPAVVRQDIHPFAGIIACLAMCRLFQRSGLSACGQPETDVAVAALAVGGKDGAVARLQAEIRIAAVERPRIATLSVMAHDVAALGMVMQRAHLLRRHCTKRNAGNKSTKKERKTYLHNRNCISGHKDTKK